MMSDKDRTGRQLLTAATVAGLLVIAAAVLAGLLIGSGGEGDLLRDQVLTLNDERYAIRTASESEGATVSEVAAAADASLASTQDLLRTAADSRRNGLLQALLIVTVAALCAIGGICAYLYKNVIAPFHRLEDFATQVAAGNLDAPLERNRVNPFGRFTWAFDAMRNDIKRSRDAEAQAAEAHKTALASLSHDLRTPLASLRTYAEALEMGLARDEAERAEYERVIMAKCDEASNLVESLFSHALADMDRIEVACEPIPAAATIKKATTAFTAMANVRCDRLDDATIDADPRRVIQIVENLIANALKYAPGTPIDVEGRSADDAYRITVRDFGPGVDPEDLPFVSDRFFRGKNAGEQTGAGLGLFIVQHLTTAMKGTVRFQNAHPGFSTEVTLPLAKQNGTPGTGHLA